MTNPTTPADEVEAIPVFFPSGELIGALRDQLAAIQSTLKSAGFDSVGEVVGEVHATRAVLHSNGFKYVTDALAEITRLREQLAEWIAANGPGGWINDLRETASEYAQAIRSLSDKEANP